MKAAATVLGILAVVVTVSALLFFAVVGAIFLYDTKYTPVETRATTCDDIIVAKNYYTKEYDTVCEIKLYPNDKQLNVKVEGL